MLLDPETFWIALPPEHDYFAEMYLEGVFFSVTDKEPLKENSLIIKKVESPETALIKFKVVDDKNQPINEGIVKSWIFSASIENGFTDWIDFIPTAKEPYIAEIIFSDQRNIKSESFSVFPGERKIITLKIDLIKSEIPNWVKNNAGWWAEGTINDETFIQGIQFLIKEEIIKV